MYWNNLGKCNANQGRWPLAVDRYLHALDEDPGYEAARYNLAEAYLEISRLTGSDRTDEALAHVEQALALDDKGVNWAARWLKARILHHMALAELNAADRVEIYKRAAEAIEEAKRLAPDAPEVRKTAALIAYGRELYYQSYKELMRLDELGYTMDPGFVGRLEQALRRRAYRMGIEPPPMPEPSSDKSPVRGVPPSLRGPYGPDGPR
jgi:tetratricopeptide (TPR) repeat protein